MRRWLAGVAIVVLLGVTAAAAWHYGAQFTRDFKLERMAALALPVPLGDLAGLGGEDKAKSDSLPIHIVNTTLWHLTKVTLSLETADKRRRLSTKVSQSFRSDPWAPGDIIARNVSLAAGWEGRHVRYRVVAAEGYQ